MTETKSAREQVREALHLWEVEDREDRTDGLVEAVRRLLAEPDDDFWQEECAKSHRDAMDQRGKVAKLEQEVATWRSRFSTPDICSRELQLLREEVGRLEANQATPEDMRVLNGILEWLCNDEPTLDVIELCSDWRVDERRRRCDQSEEPPTAKVIDLFEALKRSLEENPLPKDEP